MTAVPDLTLRPMTDVERAAFRSRQAGDYARQMVEYAGMTDAAAARKAEADMDRQLPAEGLLPGHHLFVAEVRGEPVGSLWLAVDPGTEAGRQSPTDGWIYDVQIAEEHRGRGLGRLLVLAGMEKARALGCASLGLNVFGGNDVAVRLYQSLGFRTRAMQMSRML